MLLAEDTDTELWRCIGVDSKGRVVCIDIKEKGGLLSRIGELICGCDGWVGVAWGIISAVVESMTVIVVSQGNAEILVESFAFVAVARDVCATAELGTAVNEGEEGMWVGGDRARDRGISMVNVFVDLRTTSLPVFQ
jgi:hypothetical protein